MSETRVVHVNDNIEGAVYIGRQNYYKRLPRSMWANPYRIGEHGDRTECIVYYRAEFLPFTGRKDLLAKLPELRGKALACWCRHDGEEPTEENACHGDVLVALLDRHTDDELREMGQ